MFETKTYINRRQELIKEVGTGLILLLGNDISPMNYADNGYPFRQDSTFLYYTGVDRPDVAVVLDADTGECILFGDNFSLQDTVWMGPQISLEELALKSGLTKVSGLRELSNRFKNSKIVHYLNPYRDKHKIYIHELLGLDLKEIPARASSSLTLGVIKQRSIKEKQEIEEIVKGVNISAEMHLTMMQMTRANIYEHEINAAVTSIALKNGTIPSYPNIITVNGQILHNHVHHNVMKTGQLLLGDFGAESTMHYAGDITRTIAVSGHFTNKQKEIYQLVLETNMKCIEACKPGVTYKSIHLLAAKIITKGLKELGLMKGDVDEAVASGAHALFFPHGLGHMLGLDVHDMENLGEDLVGYDSEVSRSSQFGLKSLRLGKKLQPGFVLTVEPGIYFIPQLIEEWRGGKRLVDFINYDSLSDYYNFGGIRIEDNVLITEKGVQVLGEPIPKTIGELKAAFNH